MRQMFVLLGFAFCCHGTIPLVLAQRPAVLFQKTPPLGQSPKVMDQKKKASGQTLVLLPKNKQATMDSLRQQDSLHWQTLMVEQFTPADLTTEEETDFFVPAQLQADRDLFQRLTAFRWGIRRFRSRSIPPAFHRFYLNGIPLFLWYAGHYGFSRWQGLQSSMPRLQTADALQSLGILPGGTGSLTALQTQAVKVRQQNQVSLQLSSRAGPIRLGWSGYKSFTDTAWWLSWGMQARGGTWAHHPGLLDNRLAYFISVAYHQRGHQWGLAVVGNVLEQNRIPAMTEAFFQLSPHAPKSLGWGLQAGRVRRTHLVSEHMPILTLQHEWTGPKLTRHQSVLLVSSGTTNRAGLDWQDAADPRPDNYRRMPAAIADSAWRHAWQNQLASSPHLLRLDWDQLYARNQNAAGGRAQYVLGERTHHTTHWAVQHRLSQPFMGQWEWTWGARWEGQSSWDQSRVKDLLGGTKWVDTAQPAVFFAHQSLATDVLLRWHSKRWQAEAQWGQQIFFWEGQRHLPKSAASHSFSRFWQFQTQQLRAAMVYKHSGKDYFHWRWGQETLPPLVRQGLAQSDAVVPGRLLLQKTVHASFSWYHQAVKWKYKLALYRFRLAHAQEWLRFYQDEWQQFVVLHLHQVAWQHQGLEWAMEGQVMPGHQVQMALQWGSHGYTQPAAYAVFKDQANNSLERGQVLWQGLPVAGSAAFQFLLGWKYQSPQRWYFSLTASYGGPMALSYNPLRRSTTAWVLSPDESSWQRGRQPSMLAAQWVWDAECGYAFQRHSFFLGLQNLFNAAFATGGYEQLRFKPLSTGPDLHPPKYFFLLGCQGLFSWRISF